MLLEEDLKLLDFDTPTEYSQIQDVSLKDVLKDISNHLTKEELLCLSIYKNSYKPRNNIYKLFIEKYYGKSLTPSGITQRKKRMLKVLEAVGALLRYKRANNIDTRLMKHLTRRQFQILCFYEKRESSAEISKKLEITVRSVERRFYRSISRLKSLNCDYFNKYIELLGEVLRFSRKFPVSKRT